MVQMLNFTNLHLAEAGLVVMAPGQARGRLLPLQRLLHLLSCEEHLNVHQILTEVAELITLYVNQRTSRGTYDSQETR